MRPDAGDPSSGRLHFREIVFGSGEFAQEIALRDRILRAPLGLSLCDEDVEREREQLHFGLFAPPGELAACAIAAPLSPISARIRQMAVAEKYQRQSHGRDLMRQLECELLRRGFRQLSLHARLPVVPFYLDAGFTAQGEDFVEVGIPHRRMVKSAL